MRSRGRRALPARLLTGAAAVAAATMIAAAPASAAVTMPASAHPPTLAPMADSGQCTADTRFTETPPAFQTLQAQQAWALSQGSGIVVAVVDSGVDASNPHLRDAVLKGVNLVKDKADATVVDPLDNL